MHDNRKPATAKFGPDDRGRETGQPAHSANCGLPTYCRVPVTNNWELPSEGKAPMRGGTTNPPTEYKALRPERNGFNPCDCELPELTSTHRGVAISRTLRRRTAFTHLTHDCEIIRKVPGVENLFGNIAVAHRMGLRGSAVRSEVFLDRQGDHKHLDLDGVNRSSSTSARAPVSGGSETPPAGFEYLASGAAEPHLSRRKILHRLPAVFPAVDRTPRRVVDNTLMRGIKTQGGVAIYEPCAGEPRCPRIQFLAKMPGGLEEGWHSANLETPFRSDRQPSTDVGNSATPAQRNRDVVPRGTRHVSLGGSTRPCWVRNPDGRTREPLISASRKVAFLNSTPRAGSTTGAPALQNRNLAAFFFCRNWGSMTAIQNLRKSGGVKPPRPTKSDTRKRRHRQGIEELGKMETAALKNRRRRKRLRCRASRADGGERRNHPQPGEISRGAWGAGTALCRSDLVRIRGALRRGYFPTSKRVRRRLVRLICDQGLYSGIDLPSEPCPRMAVSACTTLIVMTEQDLRRRRRLAEIEPV
jgi:hypothetical protein